MLILVQSKDEQRSSSSSSKKKDKRQLDHSLGQPYPNYRLERRISDGQHHYSPIQYYPGPPHLYRKGRPSSHSLPAPPYAVQMEPLIHYSQRDPLYDTNTNSLSSDVDPSQDLTNGNSVDRGGRSDTIYIPHKPFIKYIEKPVYIKEPEPIIEIIIKESNISLPAPPTEAPPPPQKKKKEEVQVFYVKYKKNPHGHGKDSVIYDKPVPAISPVIHEDPEPEHHHAEEEWKDQSNNNYGYSNEVTEPPRPSTTLRTIIKPDSEVYHSPGNNVKVTFGKEGFDYDKRSSKPEDYAGPPTNQRPENNQFTRTEQFSRPEQFPSRPQQFPRSEQYPRAIKLSSYSDVYFKRNANNHHSSNPAVEYRTEFRQPQPYRPFNNYNSQSTNYFNSRPSNKEFNSNNRPPPSFFPPSNRFPPSNAPSSFNQSPSSGPNNAVRPSIPHFSHSISHPPPPQFYSQSKPNFGSVPTTRYQQQQSHHSEIPPPNQRQPVPYTPFDNLRPSQPSFSQPLSNNHEQRQQLINQPQPTSQTIHQQTSVEQHLPSAAQNIQFRPEVHFNAHQTERPSEVNLHQFNPFDQPQFNHQQQHQLISNNAAHHQHQYQEHIDNVKTVQKILPPGGELLQSLPKFEQHLIVDPATGKLSENLPLHRSQAENSFRISPEQQKYNNKQGKKENQQETNHQQFLQGFNTDSSVQRRPQTKITPAYNFKSIRTVSTTTAKTTTTTEEPEKPSTTTKDPKILQAQLPDEVPEDLRQQLLSSGILNNADISILDYDKVGDIPLSALPPEQLANFYGAGGGQQLAAAGSEQIPKFSALTASRKELINADQEMSGEESEISEVAVKPSPTQDHVEKKIVKYNNPEIEKEIQDAYISKNATTTVDPVLLNDNTYNRYLPLQINGTQFPIPNVPELKGKLISSVVILAPIINYNFSSSGNSKSSANENNNDIEFIQNDPLKKVLVDPNVENYKNFLENEKKINVAKQVVILLVVSSPEKLENHNKEIFMYDITTKTVNKLDGELSSAFVEAAEANSSDNNQNVDTNASFSHHQS